MIHISVARKMLNSGQPCELCVWKQDGSIMHLGRVRSMRYDFYGGTRNVKILSSGEIRRIRDCCIFQINGIAVRL